MAEYIEREIVEDSAEYDIYHNLVVPIRKVRAIPAADVAPVVHGKRMITGRTERAMCSNCGNKYRKHYSDYFYCPLCGAKMDLED